MTEVKEKMLYIDERIVLKDIVNDLVSAVDIIQRLSKQLSYRVDNVQRLDAISLSEVESIRDYLDSILRLSVESIDDFQQGADHLSDLVVAIKDNRKSGGVA
jgi:hypothetical protein|tara:strand:- start:26692 stop:26997 length:306 start_codon:yes stop_codon:yes gene_type:complete